MIKFTIPGEPQGKARPRVTRFGTFTPTKTVNYETLVKEMYAISNNHIYDKDTQLQIEVSAYYKIPKSVSKRKREQMIKTIHRPTKKPDCDNVLKIITDALNGIAYHDDSQIVRATVEKYYSEQPRVEVILQEVV